MQVFHYYSPGTAHFPEAGGRVEVPDGVDQTIALARFLMSIPEWHRPLAPRWTTESGEVFKADPRNQMYRQVFHDDNLPDSFKTEAIRG